MKWPVETGNLSWYSWFHMSQFQVPFDFNFQWWHGFQNTSYWCTCICNIMTNAGPIRSSPKEKRTQYIRRAYSRWQSHSSPYSVLTNLAYTIVVSVPVEEHNIHIHTSPLIPQVALTHLTLRGQRCIHYKNVFTSCRSDHKIFLGLHTP
jgi:hypothetical protein